jgi:phosphatidylserine/phosphatidylglycerophosphate/cardiolipin synthase-like enzyme
MLVHQVGMATHQQVMQHLYGDQRDHRYLYTRELISRAAQGAGLNVHRTVQGWGPIGAHMVVLAEKP